MLVLNNTQYTSAGQFERNGMSISRLNCSKRVLLIHLELNKIEEFFKRIKHVTVRDLEYIPYYRYLIAHQLNQLFDNFLKIFINNILNTYEVGAFCISIDKFTDCRDDFIKFSTAISHMISNPNIDLLSGKYYATFVIEHDDSAPINLLRPYDNFKMHTDGAFMAEPTDWVLFMKMYESNVVGGLTKILHMEDWVDFQSFYDHPLGNNKVKFSGPQSSDKRSQKWGNHRQTDSLYSLILNVVNGRKLIRFVDQFVHPKNIEEAIYISEIQDSLEASNNIIKLELLPGSILVINNNHWVHGRDKFESNKNLKRELMRQRGALVHA